uniref:HAUS augmin-like complex subunit 7 n=1 Tax=Schistocephalus solidus TaxID=70667 RepID=A0A183SC04_SCHSO
LPKDDQTLWASGSENHSVSWLGEMEDRMLEVLWLQPLSIAQLSTFHLPMPIAHLVMQMAALKAKMASLKLQLARLSPVDHPVAHPAIIGLTRGLKLLMSLGNIPILAQRPIGTLPLVPFNSHRETSLSENRGDRLLWLLWLWSHFPCLRSIDSQTVPSGHWSSN